MRISVRTEIQSIESILSHSGVDGGDGDCLHLKAVCYIVVSCLEFDCILKLLH